MRQKRILWTVVIAVSGTGGLLLGSGLQPCGWLDIFLQRSGCLHRFQHIPGMVALAFAPDSEILVSGTADGSLILWNMTDGQLIRRLESGMNSVVQVAFAPDGLVIASSHEERVNDGYRDTVKLWRISDGSLIDTLEGHTDRIQGLTFAPDGHTLVSVADNGVIKMWDMSDGTLIHTLRKSSGNSVAFAPDGQTLAVGGYAVQLWNPNTATLLGNLGSETTVWSIAFAPDGQTLAVGSGPASKTVEIWRVRDKILLQTLTGHVDEQNGVQSVAFAPAGHMLASSDLTIKLWDVENGTLLRTLDGHTRSIKSLAFAPNGQMLASAGLDGTVIVWNITSDQ